jgi:dipeptidase E
MKFYLSSYRIGKEAKKLIEMMPKNRKTAYISNALDEWDNPEKRKQNEAEDMAQLRKAGLKVELLDLRKYFNKKEELRKKLGGFGAIWVSGGNTFVLRQAMKLSGFDEILKSLTKADMLYGGYSAGICVLAPSLRGIELADNPRVKPYKNSKLIWDGLGILDYSIVPHYKSDHPESEAMNLEVEYYKRKKIPFKTLRDGEVIIID